MNIEEFYQGPASSWGVLDFPRDAFVTARVASGTATIYVSAGIGL